MRSGGAWSGSSGHAAVLRLMAQAIHTLWEGGDNGLLILPASVPLHAPTVQGEIRNYLNDNWGPILEKDVDGEGALPLWIDEENASTLGRYSAARRVARTVFMGTVPRSGSSNPGITDARIRLGSVQPGETTATFGGRAPATVGPGGAPVREPEPVLVRRAAET